MGSLVESVVGVKENECYPGNKSKELLARYLAPHHNQTSYQVNLLGSKVFHLFFWFLDQEARIFLKHYSNRLELFLMCGSL